MLTQLQVACLVANAFFCTYPRRNQKVCLPLRSCMAFFFCEVLPLRTASRDHQPPTTNHQLPTATNRQWPTASGYQPPTAHCHQPPITNHQPPPTTTNRQSSTANC